MKELYRFRQFLTEGKLLKEASLRLISDDDAEHGIFIGGAFEGDLFLTTSIEEWEEMKDTPTATESGIIEGNGIKIYWNFGRE
jgi:hypothetical protein